jgi:RNA polymerase-binding transcription factor
MADEALRVELEKQLQQLQARLASLKVDASQGHSGDSAEQAQERENDEVVDAIGNETRQSIREIQSALERVAAGTYGICDSCGEDISAARLKALPQATCCVNCAK